MSPFTWLKQWTAPTLEDSELAPFPPIREDGLCGLSDCLSPGYVIYLERNQRSLLSSLDARMQEIRDLKAEAALLEARLLAANQAATFHEEDAKFCRNGSTRLATQVGQLSLDLKAMADERNRAQEVCTELFDTLKVQATLLSDAEDAMGERWALHTDRVLGTLRAHPAALSEEFVGGVHVSDNNVKRMRLSRRV